jgi:RimJ/RimL family protein N-acetyltransferase
MTDPLLLEFPETIETERLLLRPPQRADAQMIYEAVIESQAELERFMSWMTPGNVYTLEEAIRYTRLGAADSIRRQTVPLSIWRKEDNTFIGNTGLHDIEWEYRRFEIGYWLRTSMSGHGYMTEAVNALTRFCFDVLEATRVEIQCDADNERSAAVALRTGYTQEARLRHAIRANAGNLSDRLIFGMIRPDYDALIGKADTH